MRFFHPITLIIVALSHLAVAQPVMELIHTDEKPYSDSVAVHPDAAISFTKSFEGRGNGLAAQAADALQQLDDALSSSGLSRGDVANVRAYLTSAKGEDMSDHMGAWNEAFKAFFADNPLPPTRTTIGSFAAIDPDSLIAIDAIIASSKPSASAETLPANPRLMSGSENQLRSIAPYSSLLITSGVLADPLQEGGRDFGDMEQQTQSTLQKLEATLISWGLHLGDLAFTRVMLSPELDEEENRFLDTDGFLSGWEAFWSEKRVAAPPFSVFSGPGFSNSGRLIEIEFYAAFPDASGPFSQFPTHGEEQSSPILRAGNPTSFLSGSVALARDAKKIWLSGAIDRDRDTIHGQATEALLTLHDRLADHGIDFSSTAQLRAYLNFDGPFGPNFGNWNTAYRRFFDHKKVNPEKPVRTAFPIENLPSPLLIEIEVLAATRD
ncbi:Rid family hydrolase [Pelagicoccus sp. SDUM812003]|uniref:Rid family hydrolase n=1 Tax=Pelagicoccus sp. SDUM812003 TaxID=3041267 RepID=UPI00280EA334|nr:Rid family hydrolase [Pelagicoccus sp. SDUM812003]MDQ8204041.1 Rid family hydrolase [Pelagicoccus sp. SDUM812003]